MHIFVDAIIALAVAPVFAFVALAKGLLTWLRRGGPDTLFSAWQVVLYFHDRFLVANLSPTPLRRFIKYVQRHRKIHQSWARQAPSTWVWKRTYDSFSDPIIGPLVAITFGAFTLRIIVYLLVDVAHVPSALESQGPIALEWARYLRLLAASRGERNWGDWLLMALYLLSTFHIVTGLMDRAVLKSSQRAYESILETLSGGPNASAGLREQQIPDDWIPYSAFETTEGRRLLRVDIDLKYRLSSGSALWKLPTAPNQHSSKSLLKVYAFVMSHLGSEHRPPPVASYCLLNPRGVQIVVLERPAPPQGGWMKFKLLHEIGHLRGPGIRSLLVRNERFTVLAGGMSVAALAVTDGNTQTLGAAVVSVAAAYLLWTL